jgi:DegV family protein with EDD domain
VKKKVALITDSACDLPQEIIQEHSIRVLPLKIIYGDHEYSDRVDIQPEEVYSKMPQKIPTTSMPCLGEIKHLFEEIKEQGFEKVLAIHLSSGLSGTFETVKMWAQEVKGMHIEVFDSKVLGIALGMQVWAAAKDIASGLDFQKIMDNVRELRSKVRIYFVLETLDYLRKGGRIGRVEAALGSLLQIKPIISCDAEGEYYTVCKARGRANSIEKLIHLVEEAAAKGPIKLAIAHGGAYEEAMKVKERLRHLPNVKEIIFGQISPALGVHTGPGLIGACFHEI